MDPRIKELADLLTDYSTDIQQGTNVLITYKGEMRKHIARQIIKNVYPKAGMK